MKPKSDLPPCNFFSSDEPITGLPHRCFGGGGGGRSSQSAENERLNGMLLKQQLVNAAKKQDIQTPAIPVAPLIAPPPQQGNQDAVDAATEARRAAARRHGFKASNLGAGSTGGFLGGTMGTGKSTLG